MMDWIFSGICDFCKCYIDNYIATYMHVDSYTVTNDFISWLSYVAIYVATKWFLLLKYYEDVFAF